MFYINQQEYPHIPYPNNIQDPTSRGALHGTVASSACGLCSMMMVLDRLTMSHPSIEEMVALSQKVKANLRVGTNMKVLGEACCRLYDLTMTCTNSTEEMAACLQEGGAAIINVGGNHDDYFGVLSDVGHYVMALSYCHDEFCILDPAYRPAKYIIPCRKGKVREDGLLLYVKSQILLEDTANRDPGFYLFRRKSCL